MKKTGAILLSIILIFMMTVTNLAGAYNTASWVYAAGETDDGADNQDGSTQGGDETALTNTALSTGDVTQSGDQVTTIAPPQETAPANTGDPANTPPQDLNQTPSPQENVPANTGEPVETQQHNSVPVPQEASLTPPENNTPAATFTVTFDANGHGSAPAAVSVEAGKSIAKPDEPVAEGFTFCGWFRDAAATVLWNFDSDVVSENITLYAGWTENAPDSTTRLPENPNEENELVTNGEGEHGNAPVEGGNEPGNHAEESNIVSTPVSNGENIVPTDTTNEEESTTTQDALNITGASESGQEASALQTSTMLRSAPPALNAPLQNGGLRAGQDVYLTLKYEGSGLVHASEYIGTAGTTVEIRAVPSDGYRFKNWEIVSGTGSIGAVNNNLTTFTMGTTDATVKAVFESLPAGGSSLACFVDYGGTASATANPNDSAAYTLQATPASGYKFDYWVIVQGNGSIANSHAASTTINCSGSVVVEARFSTITYPITTNANPGEGGSAERLPYNGGPAQQVNLTATPNAGYSFKEWKITSGEGTIRNPKAANTVLENITSEVTCEAVFEAVPTGQYGVHLTKNYDYGGEVKASASYGSPGTAVTLTATPASGYVFRRWAVEQGNVTIDSPDSATTTFQIGSEDVTVKAVFIPDTHDYYNITTQAYGCGSALSNTNQAISGSRVQLKANPESGWSFDHWEVVSGGVTIDNEYAREAFFVMRDQDVVVRAVFVPEQANLLSEIKVTNPPKKDTYTAGESFDPDGMVVTAYYQGGSADVSGYTCEPSGALAETDTLITIRYTINGVTKETTLPITVSPRPAPAKYIVSVNASPSNGGTVTGGGTYADGASVTVRATANTGYKFLRWMDGTSAVSTEAAYTFTAESNRSLTAEFEIDTPPVPVQYTISVGANPAEGGTVTGGGIYKESASVTVKAVPFSNYDFAGWYDDTDTLVSSDATYTFAVNADRTLTAKFNRNTAPPVSGTHTVTVSANPTVGGTVTGSGSYNHGDTASVTATANAGYTFKQWTRNGTVVGTNTTYSFTVNADTALVAEFDLNQPPTPTQFNVSVDVQNGQEGWGTVTGGGTYNKDATVTIAATASPGYEFVRWVDKATGNNRTEPASFTHTVTGNIGYVAVFRVTGTSPTPATTHAVTVGVSSGQEGYGSVAGGGVYKEGADVTVRATANTGYKFLRWMDGASEISKDAEYTFTLGTTDRNLTAEFEIDIPPAPKQYTISVSANPAEGGTVTGGGTYAEGEPVSVTATANSGYKFSRWVEGGTAVSGNTTYTFTASGTRDLVAEFVQNATVTSVTVTPSPVDVIKGKTQQFTAQVAVSGAGSIPKTVTWSVSGAGSSGTKIDARTGELSVAANETATVLTVKATSDADPTKTGTATVNVKENVPGFVTVTFDAKGGTAVASRTVTKGSTISAPTSTRAGYILVGWFDPDDKPFDFSKPVNADVQLTAKWKSDAVVTGITVSPASAEVVIDRAQQKDGSQQFTAKVEGTGAYSSAVTWSVSGNKSTKTTISAEGLLTVGADETAGTLTVTAVSDENASVKATAAVTVTEKQPDTYTVKFDANGGSAVASQQVKKNEKAVIPADPTRSGYTFKGWNLNGKPYDFNTPVTSDITLTADWKQNDSTELSVDARGFTDADIPQSLIDAGYDTTGKIQGALLQAVVDTNGSAYEKNYALYEVVLMVSFDGGKTWVAATPENFPEGGITVEIPYPSGTNGNTHNFVVAHMFTMHMHGHKPGEIENPNVTKRTNGIRVTLDGLSPVLVAWTEISNQSNPTNPSNPSNPAQPSNPGSGSAPSPQATGSEGQNATGGTDTVATRTNAQGARSASGAQNTNARGGQTGDDMYERLGLHTLVLLAALLLLIAQLRKLMDENKLLAISASCSVRKIPDSGSGNQKRNSRVKRAESGLEFIEMNTVPKSKPRAKRSGRNKGFTKGNR